MRLVSSAVVLITIGLLCCRGYEGTDDDVGQQFEPERRETSAIVKLQELTSEDLKIVDASTETHEYRAEVSRLMDIIINSLYTDKDVFLRELISNSADAIEKVRLMGLTNKSVLLDSEGQEYGEFEIFIHIDPEKHELSITDTGIGMTKQDLTERLGTVASSGTGSFIDTLMKGISSSSALIGQFGVGFYSVFLVADKVTVITKHPNDDQYVWEASKEGKAYKLYKDPRGNVLRRGTRVIVSLSPEARKYERSRDLRSVITKFSEFITYPIFVQTDVDKNPDLWTKANPTKALWMREKSEITDQEYQYFYRNFTKDHADALAWSHFKAEGDTEFTALLYVPSSNKDIYTMFSAGSTKVTNIRLYVRRVFITDALENFLPRWMGFVRGIVDADDLPLKVDRETFSQTRVMRTVQATVIKKTLELFKQWAKKYDEELEGYAADAPAVLDMEAGKEKKEAHDKLKAKYEAFHKYSSMWSKWGQSFVLGCTEDAKKDQKLKIGELIRAVSSKSPKYGIGFDTYISRMKENQQDIYYITGESSETLMSSPYVEAFIDRDIEVMFLVHALEEGCINELNEFKGHKLVSIEKNLIKPGDLDFSEEAKAEETKRYQGLEKYFSPLINHISKYLGTLKASSVVLSTTLVESPAMISSPVYGMTANTERIARSQAATMDIDLKAFAMMKNFEINPDHPLIVRLLDNVMRLDSMTEGDDLKKAETQKINNAIDFFYEAAMIASGYPPRRPKLVIDKLYKTIALESGLPSRPRQREKDKTEVPQWVWDELEAAAKASSSSSSDDDDDDLDDLDSPFVKDTLKHDDSDDDSFFEPSSDSGHPHEKDEL